MKKAKNKLYLIIGASCSGKTSFTQNTFFKGEYKVYKDLMLITETKDYYFIGRFGEIKGVDSENIHKVRRKGTDTINRNDIKNIREQVDRLKDKPVVLEGVRICSYKLMDYFAQNYDCYLFFMNCSFEKSFERFFNNYPNVNKSSLKATYTMVRNFYNKYWKDMNGCWIDTNNINDFSKFNYEDYKDKFIKGGLECCEKTLLFSL